MKIQTTGKDIRTWQTFERKLRTVRTSTNWLHIRFHAYGFHSSKSDVNNVHYRFYLFTHIIILVAQFKSYSAFTIFGIHPGNQAFYLFLTFFEFSPVMVTNNIRNSALLHFALNTDQMIESLVACRMFRSFYRRQQSNKLIGKIDRVNHLIFGVPRMYIASLKKNLGSSSIKVFKL